MLFREIGVGILRRTGLLPKLPVDASPTLEDLRFVRVMRALGHWRAVGDAAATEQPYRDALAQVLAEYPHLAEVPRARARVV